MRYLQLEQATARTNRLETLGRGCKDERKRNKPFQSKMEYSSCTAGKIRRSNAKGRGLKPCLIGKSKASTHPFGAKMNILRNIFFHTSRQRGNGNSFGTAKVATASWERKYLSNGKISPKGGKTYALTLIPSQFPKS